MSKELKEKAAASLKEKAAPAVVPTGKPVEAKAATPKDDKKPKEPKKGFDVGLGMDVRAFIESRKTEKGSRVIKLGKDKELKFDFGFLTKDRKIPVDSIPLAEYRALLLAKNDIEVASPPEVERVDGDILNKHKVKRNPKAELKWGAFYEQMTQAKFTVTSNGFRIFKYPGGRKVFIVKQSVINACADTDHIRLPLPVTETK